ncbi:TMEM43 family protein [bacterium]|nr:TMEM43 family protein [bacterium]
MSFNVNLGGVGVNPGRAAAGGCGSVFGMLFGIVLIPLSFFMVYYGEAKLVNHGVVFARTAMVTADAAAASAGGQLVKFKGRPTGDFIRSERYGKPVLYWHRSLEQYEADRDSEGHVDYDWETKSSASQWASFSISGIQIVADKANAVGEKTVFKGVRRPSDKDFRTDRLDQTPQVGDQRLTVQVIDADQELIVLGQVTGKSCSGGSSFVVSALDEAGTAAALRLEYKIMYWVLKGGAVLVMWMGLLSFFGPLMSLVGWVPLLGQRLSGALAFGALFMSLVVVGVTTVAVQYFWVIVAIVVAVILVLTIRGITSPRQRPGTVPPVGATYVPPPSVPLPGATPPPPAPTTYAPPPATMPPPPGTPPPPPPSN